jgi:hypothetical protein
MHLPDQVPHKAQFAGFMGGKHQSDFIEKNRIEPGSPPPSEAGRNPASFCSNKLSEPKFFEILKESARDAKVGVRIIEKRGQSADYPVLLSFPQSHYLKCFFLENGGLLMFLWPQSATAPHLSLISS